VQRVGGVVIAQEPIPAVQVPVIEKLQASGRPDGILP
jgi:hypothetical protein